MVGADASLMSGVMSFVIIITFLNMALVLAKVQASRSGKHATTFMNWGLNRVEGARKFTQGNLGRGSVRTAARTVSIAANTGRNATKFAASAATGFKYKPKYASFKGQSMEEIDKENRNTWWGTTRAGRYMIDKTTGNVMKAKFGSGHSIKEVDKENADLNREYGSGKKEKEIAAIIARGKKAKVDSEEHFAMLRALNQMSDKELEKQDMDLLTRPEVASELSGRAILALTKSDNISDGDKKKLKDVRYGAIIKEVAAQGENGDIPSGKVKDDIQDLSEKEIDLLDRKLVLTGSFIRALKSGQVDKMLGSDNYTSPEKEIIKKARLVKLNASIDANDYAEVGKLLKKVGNAGVAKLPTPTLEKDVVIANLTTEMLKKIAEDKAEVVPTIIDFLRDPAKVDPATGEILATPVGARGTRTKHPAWNWIQNGQGKDTYNP
jgi:hypothetical protein